MVYSKNKKELNENKRAFFMSFFEEEEGYEEKEVNGWWLIKQWDGNVKRWTVHLYSQQSYNNLKRGQAKYSEMRGGLLDDAFQTALELDEAADKHFKNWPRT